VDAIGLEVQRHPVLRGVSGHTIIADQRIGEGEDLAPIGGSVRDS
jgi:hypothetical protein